MPVRVMILAGLAALAGCGGEGEVGGGGDMIPPPSSLSYTSPVIASVGLPIPVLVPAVQGSPSSWSVTPSLPAGVALDTSTGVISGTPSAVAASAVYTVTATNAQGSAMFALSLKVDPPPDVFAPQGVEITSPAAAAIVSGSVPVTAIATDDVAVARVLFSVRADNATIDIADDTSAPWSVDWNTATVANGAATLTATAFDMAGNSTTSWGIEVTVNNAATTSTLAGLQATVFGAHCAGCHNGTGPSLPNSMNLTSVTATAAALIDVPSVESPMLKRVSPGDPDNSYLIQKLEGTAPFGLRMPFGGPYLDQMTINQVRDWIQAGAAP